MDVVDVDTVTARAVFRQPDKLHCVQHHIVIIVRELQNWRIGEFANWPGVGEFERKPNKK